ncbi:MAG: acetate--CoA ligase family protein [Archaeoglobaceae archaeon]|uniref:acetate--CoA ligase (ADP-forming) n=1 Tax=Archaeoglobus fulgidus TaxID=2234 RepID=A0A7J3M3S0_ARCFL
MRSFFYPNSIALVGASAKKGSVGNVILKNLKKFGGKIYAINPNHTEIEGVECFPSVESLPEVVDLAIIATPARTVSEIVDECGRKGIKNVIVISAGFRETGSEGAVLEEKVAEIARKHGIRLLGPNCLGVINPEINLNATFSEIMPRKGKIAFLSQSGAFILAVILWAQKSKFGFSKIVSMGNKAVLSEADFLRFFATDEKTEAIMLYVEGIRNGKEFMEVARKVAREKPIIVMKAGKTESGARAASSHTGSLAGSYEIYKTAFEQCGIVVAETVEELFDFSFALSRFRRAGRVAIVTNSGGPGVMASDAVEINGLELANFKRETIEELRKILPPSANFYNPVDILGDADTERFVKALDAVEVDENVGSIVAILAPTAQIDYRKAVDRVLTSKKPIFCCFMGLDEFDEERLIESRIPNFFDPSRAVKVISAVERYSSFEFRDSSILKFEIDKERADKFFEGVKGKFVGVEGMKLLECYGIKVAPFDIAQNVEEALEIADRIGYPVVLKVVSPDIVHKSDIGALKLNVTRDKLETEFFEMLSKVERLLPNARIEGVMVQKMISGGREVILGMKKDPSFGNVLMFGLGGIYVEVFKDVSFKIAPLSKEDAYDMIKKIKSYPLLRGVRGEKGVDIDAIAETILRFSQLGMDYPILEMEINPLKVFEDGCVAIDFRMLLEVGK